MAKISIDLNSGGIAKESAVIGIDLGTTNSLIATIDETDRTPYCIESNSQNLIPSAIFFENGEIIVGQGAQEKMVEHPENTIYSVKRLLGKSYNDIQSLGHRLNYEIIDDEDRLVKVKVGSAYYSPIELSAAILKKLKSSAESKLNKNVNKVVITVPAYFNDSQRQATRDAGKLAGLDVLRIINEPTAASLAYGLGLQSESKMIAVYDLGGGTFDVSILNIQNGIFEVLSTNGDTFLGGDDFDKAIVAKWSNDLAETSLSASDHQLLRLTAEKAKKALSSNDSFAEKIRIAGQVYTFLLNKEQLIEIVKPLIDRTMTCCLLALKDAELHVSDIEEVVLVGGSTHSPIVKERVKNFFNHSSINDQHNPDEVVALGAALEADILAGNRKDMLLLDVTPLSLGIETLGGTMDVLIPRNNKIPSTFKKEYTTSVDGQINLAVNVYQGEREMVVDNRKLGEFVLKDIPSMPAGLPKIEMTFMINADGILHVSAKELRSGVHQKVDMTPQYGITDEKIKSMLSSSIKNAKEDMEKRSIAESETEAKQLIYATEKFLKENSDLVPNKDAETIKQKISSIQQAIDAKHKDRIVTATEELNNFTRQYAEQVMDKSISKALSGKNIK